MNKILFLTVIAGGGGPTAPVNSVLPAISGTPTVGQLLTATTGTWTGTAPITYGYQWKRGGVDIGGATASTYTLVGADAGAVITVTVTATNAAGNASATSAGTAAVAHTADSKILALNPPFFWPLEEPSGSTIINSGTVASANGAYVNALPNQSTFLNGDPVPRWDGAGDAGNIYSAALNANFTPAEFTISMWIKLFDGTVWSDGVERRAITILVDGSNLITIRKNTTNGQFVFVYTAGGTTKQVVMSSQSRTDFYHVAMTVSKSNDRLRAYVDGAQIGTTQTALGTFAGSLVSSGCNIGANANSGTNSWNGYEAKVAIFNSEFSAAQILSLATLP